MDEDDPLDDQIDERPSETREIGGSVEEFNSLTDVFWVCVAFTYQIVQFNSITYSLLIFL